MPDRPDKAQILRTLAERLPDSLLHELFPENSPRDIRQIIRRAVGKDEQQDVFQHSTGQQENAEINVQQTHLPFSGIQATACSLYTDGASRGNPGDAGAGIVLYDDQGNELLTRSSYLGKCTNNAAEYQALIEGLQCAGEAGCRKLHIFLDSELIVRQVQGIYKVKNAQLKPLFNQVADLLDSFQSWDIRHVPREKNARADELANKGIDERF